jgi:hypothetical protein
MPRGLTLKYLYVGMLLLCAIAGIYLYARNKNSDFFGRLMWALIPWGFFLVFCNLLLSLTAPPNELWSSARLLPTIALTKGYRIYYGPTNGPIVGWSYPPFAPLAYLPASLWHSPGQSVRAACVMSWIFYFLPALLVIASSSSGGEAGATGGGPYLGVAFFLLCSYTLFKDYVSHSYALSYTALGVGCDAPALGCAATSCALLILSQNKQRGIGFQIASAVFAALAVWSKQVTFTLFVALPLWVLLTQGIARAARFTAILFGVLILLSAVFVLAFGFPEIWFNVFALPARRAWVGRFPNNVLGASQELQKHLFVLLILPLAVVLYEWRSKRSEVCRSRWFSENRWTLPLLVALCMFPSSVMGRVQVGGDLNSFSYCLYFTLIASCALLLHLLTRPRAERPSQLVHALAAVLVALVCFVQVQNIGSGLNHFHTKETDTSIAYNFIKRHPNSAYFPMQPLAHLAAENKLYHFGFALLDRELGSFLVSEQHAAAHVPQSCDLICFRSNDPPVEKLLKGFEQGDGMPELPGWICYRRPK